VGEDDAVVIGDSVTFRPAYALAALAIFIIEVLIALFISDGFVRPYIGDALAVMLVYTALRAVTRIGVKPATAIALAIAVVVELGQLAGLLDMLDLRDNRLAATLLGGAFDLADLVAYAAGGVIVLAAEKWREER
jgi:hypothetical protein